VRGYFEQGDELQYSKKQWIFWLSEK
jgi:hypothetical protein